MHQPNIDRARFLLQPPVSGILYCPRPIVTIYLNFSSTVIDIPVSQSFLNITAQCYAERGHATVNRLSVCPSVTFRYRDHIDWNTSKIISRPNSLSFCRADPNMGDLVRREHPQKLGWNRRGVHEEHKNVQYFRNGAR